MTWLTANAWVASRLHWMRYLAEKSLLADRKHSWHASYFDGEILVGRSSFFAPHKWLLSLRICYSISQYEELIIFCISIIFCLIGQGFENGSLLDRSFLGLLINELIKRFLWIYKLLNMIRIIIYICNRSFWTAIYSITSIKLLSTKFKNTIQGFTKTKCISNLLISIKIFST